MNRSLAPLAVIALGFFFAPLAALAEPVYPVPPGLHPGDPYRLVFFTAGTTDNDPGRDVSFYNNFVSTQANSAPALAALGTTWSAIVSVQTPSGIVNAEDNSNTNPGVLTGVPMYNLAGQEVAGSNAALWSGTLLAPIDVTQTGANGGDLAIWTGTTPSGVASTLPLGYPDTHSPYGTIGLSGVTISAWVEDTEFQQFNFLSIYGISGVLTVPGGTTPEPGTMTLACLAAVGLAAPAIRRRLRKT